MVEQRIKLPNSVRKYIRREKARLRREFTDPVKVKEKIVELYTRFGI